MATPDVAEVAAETAQKAISTTSLITHIVERRIEYLLGTLVAVSYTHLTLPTKA